MQASEAYEIIQKPILTEKSTSEQERANVYRFEVAGGANRIEIKQAVEFCLTLRLTRSTLWSATAKCAVVGQLTSVLQARKLLWLN